MHLFAWYVQISSYISRRRSFYMPRSLISFKATRPGVFNRYKLLSLNTIITKIKGT